MAVQIVPPVIPAPPGTIPNQPTIPEVFASSTTIVVPLANQNNTADVVFRAICDIEIAQLETNTNAIVSVQNLQERYYKDGADFYASVYASQAQLAASEYSADRQLEAEVLRLNTIPAGALALQTNDLINKIEIETIRQATQNAATISSNQIGTLDSNNRLIGTKYSADQQLSGAETQATLDYDSRVFTAQANKDSSVYGSDQDLVGRQYTADQNLTGAKYDADQQLLGVKYSADAETTRLIDKLAYADTKFNIVFPFVQTSLANAQSSPITPGLSFTPPAISTRGVYSAGQVQRQVNQAVARNDARTNSQILQAQRDLAGRGFSSNSPLLEAVRIGLSGQNLRANNDAETQIRLQAATANASQLIQVQQLQNEQFNQQQTVALESEKNQITRQVGLVDALAQMVAGLT